MSATDAILIGEGWISEHYFTTDSTSQSFKARVLARRKVWDEQKEMGSIRSQFVSARSSLLSRLASLDDDPELAEGIRKDLVDALGYNSVGLSSVVSGPVTVVRQAQSPRWAGGRSNRCQARRDSGRPVGEGRRDVGRAL